MCKSVPGKQKQSHQLSKINKVQIKWLVVSMVTPQVFSTASCHLTSSAHLVFLWWRLFQALKFHKLKRSYLWKLQRVFWLWRMWDNRDDPNSWLWKSFKKRCMFQTGRKTTTGFTKSFSGTHTRTHVQQLLPASQQLQRSCLSKQKSWGHDCLSATSCHRPCIGRPWAWCWRKNVFELSILSILNQNLILPYTHSIRVMCCLAMGPYTKPSSQYVGHLLSPGLARNEAFKSHIGCQSSIRAILNNAFNFELRVFGSFSGFFALPMFHTSPFQKPTATNAS